MDTTPVADELVKKTYSMVKNGMKRVACMKTTIPLTERVIQAEPRLPSTIHGARPYHYWR
jgi:hypothetical protein